MHTQRLMTPGPAVLLPESLTAEAAVYFHHRGSEFKELMAHCQLRLRSFLGLGPKDWPIILTSSGTGAMEAAFVNAVSPGSAIAVFHAGRYGERWMDFARAHQVNTYELTAPYGHTFDLGEVEQLLSHASSLNAVFFQDNESSTGTRHRTQELIALIQRHHPQALIVVDAMTGVGVHPLSIQNGIDVLITGSQKSMGIHPGLSFLGLSERYLNQLGELHLPRVYFDLQREVEAQQKQVTAWTPAIGLIGALGSSLDRIHRLGGVQILQSNAHLLAESLRSALTHWGIPLFSRHPGDGVTAFSLPQAGSFIQRLKQEENIVVASGQGALEGQILRIGHLGFISANDMAATIEGIERTFAKAGAAYPSGALLKAQSFLDQAPRF